MRIEQREKQPLPPLTPYQEGLVASVENFIHLRAMKLAKHWYGEIPDLVQAGFAAATQSARNYRPKTGVPFLGFAIQRIVGEMNEEIGRCSNFSRSKARVRTEIRRKLNDTGVVDLNLSTQEVSCLTGLSPERIERARIVWPVSLDEQIDRDNSDEGDGRGPGLIDRLINPSEANPEELAIETMRKKSLVKAINDLEPRRRRIIYDVYGQELPHTEIARKMRISESRVFQLERDALKILGNSIDPDGFRNGNPTKVLPQPGRLRTR